MSSVIKNVRIIDGTGKVIENGFMKFDETSIIAVSEAPISADQEIDGTGKTIMPGLIDCHVHLGLLPLPNCQEFIQKDTGVDTGAKIYAHCVDYLKHGITTVKNMGMKYDGDIYVRNLIDQGFITGPRIIASGRCLCITGGHGWDIGQECDTVEEILKAARERIKSGAQVLKMMATGAAVTTGAVAGAQQLSLEQMTAVVVEAKRTGCITGAHCIGYDGTKAAIMSGMDSIEHGYMLDDPLIEMMVKNGQYFTPTIYHTLALAHSTDDSPAAVARRAIMAPFADGHVTALEKAIKAGVKIAAGTDGGTPNNAISELCAELKYYIQCGMTPMQALMSATKVASELCKTDSVTGTLEKGKQADFIVLSDNPLENLDTIKDVECTYRSGKLMYERGSAF